MAILQIVDILYTSAGASTLEHLSFQLQPTLKRRPGRQQAKYNKANKILKADTNGHFTDCRYPLYLCRGIYT